MYTYKTHSFDLHRPVKITDTNGTPSQLYYEIIYQNIDCNIQEFSGEEIDFNDENKNRKRWYLFCDVMDIRNGDIMVVDSVEYNIKNIEKFNFRPYHNHMEIILEKTL